MSGSTLGRPRQAHLDAAILEATRDLLSEIGYQAFTVDAVAARAGVGKASIYRRFSGKAEIAFRSAVHDLALTAPEDSGSLAGDLWAITREILHQVSSPLARTILPHLMVELSGDQAVAQRFTFAMIEAERACLVEVLRRGLRRGELSELPDPALVHAQLLGGVIAAVFLMPDVLTDGFAQALAARVAASLPGLLAS